MRILLATAALVLAGGPPLHAQGTDAPARAELADSVLARGKIVYDAKGNCVHCHGEAGRGTARGSNLTDAVWLHGDGGFLSIVEQVVHGVGHPIGGPDTPMPRGLGELSYSEVRAVSAYVWSLSHPLPADSGAAPRRRR